MIHNQAPRLRRNRRAWLIRSIDIAVSLLVLVMVAPLLALIGIAVAIDSGGSPLFAQRRIGLYGRSFLCLKFRTMVHDAERRLTDLLARDPISRAEWERDHKLRGDPRITPLGRFLRKTSLDELPQLLNVLRGEMSLVGPRPIVAAEALRYGNRYWSYCQVRPGLTGLWQISGRNHVRYRRRVAMDVLFSRRLTPTLYWRVLFGTPPALLLRRGAY